MKEYNLSLKDFENNYFHFTKQTNLNNIQKKGLIPKKGSHAKYLEESEKVFFVEGLNNLLILFDCWINVYKIKPPFPDTWKINGVVTKTMRSKYFPMILIDLYLKIIKNSKTQKKIAYKIFDKLLSENILLNLNIKENIDFNIHDTDEIKAQNFKKRHLISLGYSEAYSDMNSTKMDKWNLHTFAGQGVKPQKIKICSIDNSNNIKDILEFAIKNTTLNLKELCPNLYDYLKNRKII